MGSEMCIRDSISPVPLNFSERFSNHSFGLVGFLIGSKKWWLITLLFINQRRQRGRVVRAPDLKSGDPKFKSRSDH